MAKKISSKQWDKLWHEFYLWHTAQVTRNKCSQCGVAGGDPEWGEQQDKIEELVNKLLVKRD